MLFRAHKPGFPLSDFIENFWLYDGYSSPHTHERIFPTGTFELVFNLRDDELRIYREAISADAAATRERSSRDHMKDFSLPTELRIQRSSSTRSISVSR
jgi:hypothetical protein